MSRIHNNKQERGSVLAINLVSFFDNFCEIHEINFVPRKIGAIYIYGTSSLVETVCMQTPDQ